ncbi:MAG: ThuA domain-containing protein [Parasporobacterium sp.]|nr:ThuA domain-containing protein [Parasporobacterium sp.]
MAPIRKALEADPQMQVTCATLYDPDFGLPEELLEHTDVLIWWAHISHDAVPDELVKRIVERIQKGMGFIALHSAHKSKPFMSVLGASGTLRWREGDFCRIWNTAPAHPIAEGIPEYFELEEEEMYGEVFDIPAPDEIVFMSWFSGGELLRSGCTWTRGYGKVFYFQPGHETSPSYHNPYILRIICNAVKWAAPAKWRNEMNCPNILQSPEMLREKGRKQP